MGRIVSEKTKLLLAWITLQCCYAGFHIVSRVALNIGVSKVVYPVYKLLLLGPFAYFLEKITANQGFYILGLYYASSTLALAMQNSVPAITFVMASALRIEKVDIGRRDGLMKVLRTLASVGGATIIILYEGPPLLHSGSQQTTEGNIIQLWDKLLRVKTAPVWKKYPAKLSLTSFTCFFGLLQFSVIVAFAEREPKHWQIQSGEEIFTFSNVLYLGHCFLWHFLTMMGLYSVLWGKNEEKRVAKKENEEKLRKNLLDHGERKHEECVVIVSDSKTP
ncbi:hypothetical protein LguiA_020952 [Lonicera macranthoides]